MNTSIKWAIGIVILALAIWFVILPWIRKYRAEKKHRAQSER